MNWFMVSFIPAFFAAIVVFAVGMFISPPLAFIAAILVFFGAL